MGLSQAVQSPATYRTPVPDRLALLGAAASMARATHAAVRILLPRQPGVVASARAVAARVGVPARVELAGNSITITFADDGSSGAHGTAPD